jgi:hypothetical protein
MVKFFERIRTVALANIDKIDALVLYTDPSIEHAKQVLWSLVHLDPVQLPYMLHGMRWLQQVLSGAPEVRRYTDYNYTSWSSDLLAMIKGTEESLAHTAVAANVSLEHLFDLETDGLAQFIELLAQSTGLKIYYTRMVDKMLRIIRREKSSAHRTIYYLLRNNRVQLEDVLHTAEFELRSITGHEVGIDDILLLVDTMFEELLPAEGLGGIYTETESRRTPGT